MTNSEAVAADTIDLADIGHALKRGWRAIVGFTVLGAVGAAAVIAFAPRRFTTTSSIVLRTGSDASGSVLARLAGGLGDAGGLLGGSLKSPIETEMQILSSRAVVGAVVDSLRLQVRVTKPAGTPPASLVADYQLNALFAPVTLRLTRQGAGYTISGPNGLSAQATPGVPVNLPIGSITLRSDLRVGEMSFQVRDRADAIDRVNSRLTITKAGGEVAGVNYSGDDSLTSAAVPNQLIATYLARRKTTDRGVNQHRVEFLVAKSDSAAADLAKAEDALRRQQEATGVLDPAVVGKLELERSGQLRASLTDLDVEDGAIKQLVARVKDGSVQPRELAAYPTFLKSAGINELLSQLTQIETERLKRLDTRTENDPEVVALAQSAKNVEAQLLPLATSYASTIERQRTDLAKRLDSVQTAIAKMPVVAESGLRMQRDVVRLGQIYGALQAQLVDARLAAIQEGGEVRALDPAAPPRQPSFPKPLSTAGIGIAAGFGCGVVAALLLSALGRWVQDERQIEQATGYPALRFGAGTPLIIGDDAAQTILVVPVGIRARAEPVARQLAETATARSLRATVLDLSEANAAFDVNGRIERLAQENDLVVVQLPGFDSAQMLAALRRNRPVVLVVPGGRVDRAELNGAVQTLRRLDMQCAGIVLSGAERDAVLAR